MKKIDSFIGIYSLSKTLCFSLLPVGKTIEHFEAARLLAEDEVRAKEYDKMKKIIDRYHKQYIESVLSKTFIEVKDYAELYYKSGKTDKDKKSIEKEEEKLRKAIVKALTSGDDYKMLSKAGEMITKLLPPFAANREESDMIEHFNGFTTYFTGFFENRKNMYSAEKKSNTIAYRIVNENLPKFLDNIKSFRKIAERLPVTDIENLHRNFDGNGSFTDMFELDYFSFVLSQSGIDKYNDLIGGHTLPDGVKIQGLNEYINLYNQTVPKDMRLPKLKQLFKQILSESESFSFIVDKFADDTAVLNAINDFYTTDGKDTLCIKNLLPKFKSLFCELKSFDLSGIYILSGKAVTDISQAVSGYWGTVRDRFTEEYVSLHPLTGKKKAEKYEEEKQKAYKSIGSFSLAQLQQYLNEDICEYYSARICTMCDTIEANYNAASKLLNDPYTSEKRLFKNDKATELIKNFLDSIKTFELFIKPFMGTGIEDNNDELFYGEFSNLFYSLSLTDRLYDKVRNYMTQKPYSTDKIKLNFSNAQLLNGWDKNKEPDCCCVLLQRGKDYYLAVMDKKSNRVFENIPECVEGESTYTKIEYKLLPGPNKMLPKVFFSASRIDEFAPSAEILRIRESETFKKGDAFNIDDCRKLIDFYKSSIERHPEWREFGFKFSPTESYSDISGFYKEVQQQGYKITKADVPCSYVDSLVNTGKIYLFRIYNKDFSEHSTGTPNLHTLYFKMLFDDVNLGNVVYKLNGQAEMFYRKPSITKQDMTVHPANQPIKTKNTKTKNATSVFPYDLIKDKRYTKPQFSIHIPITLNFKATENALWFNDAVRAALCGCDDNYIIGIDRGERNLIYYCVINGRGEIVEQGSFNNITDEHKGEARTVDYHELLDRKEKERDEKRRCWGTIESIKDLKDGYVSQVVHKICELVIKYDAVIAMEDLNSGFKNSRAKVEKQVYQKFEKMLIDKLGFLADKKSEPTVAGGLLNAYQLTKPFDSFKKMGLQNGFIFYVAPWLTSKIDPTTGFVDLLHPHFTSVDAAKKLIDKLDSIIYNAADDLFEITFDYNSFPKCGIDHRGRWTVCSNSTRIHTFGNPQKNNEYDNEELHMTDEFKKFFTKYGIDHTSADLKDALLNGNSADFYKEFISLFKLTLQMRNSVTGRTDIDYLISPVKNSDGVFYDSRNGDPALPLDADANGAYNIARKAMWAIAQIKAADDPAKARITIKNAEWLEFAQK